MTAHGFRGTVASALATIALLAAGARAADTFGLVLDPHVGGSGGAFGRGVALDALGSPPLAEGLVLVGGTVAGASRVTPFVHRDVTVFSLGARAWDRVRLPTAADDVPVDGLADLQGRLVLLQTGPDYLVRLDGEAVDPDFTFTRGTLVLTRGDAAGLARQAGGGLVVAIRDSVVRHRDDGTLDASFGGGAAVPEPGAAWDAVAVDPDDRILVAGTVAGRLAVRRLAADGVPDGTFATDPGPVLDPGVPTDGRIQLALDADGGILVAGPAPGGPIVMRLLVDGTRDAAFGSGGSVKLADVSAVAGIAARHGAIVLLATGAEGPSLVRLLGDGTPDVAFAPNGRALLPAIEDGFTAANVEVAERGEIRIAGTARRVLSGRGGPTTTTWAALVQLCPGPGTPGGGDLDGDTLVDGCDPCSGGQRLRRLRLRLERTDTGGRLRLAAKIPAAAVPDDALRVVVGTARDPLAADLVLFRAPQARRRFGSETARAKLSRAGAAYHVQLEASVSDARALSLLDGEAPTWVAVAGVGPLLGAPDSPCSETSPGGPAAVPLECRRGNGRLECR